MKPLSSPIFEAYTEIMMKQAEEKESKELKKYKSDKNPRNGSDDEETIKNLYNNKIDMPKDMEYEINIIERAHPNTVVIAPAYDPINGIVENQNQQSAIIRNLIMKEQLPSGTIRLTRNAEQELTMELIRIANDMDNADQEELRVLADSCLAELKKNALSWDDAKNWFSDKIKDVGVAGEGAAAGAGIGALVGALIGAFGANPLTVAGGATAGAWAGGALGGLVASLAKTAPQVQSIQENAHKVLDQLADLKNKVPDQSDFFGKVEDVLNRLSGDATRYQQMIDDLQMKANQEHHTPSQSELNDAETLATNLKNSIFAAEGMGRMFSDKAKSGEFAKAGPSKALTPLYWFISDDVEDVEDAFQSLDSAIKRFVGTMKDIHGVAVEKASEEPKAGENTVAVPNNSGGMIHNIDDFKKFFQGIT